MQIGLESIGVGCVGVGLHVIPVGVFCDEVQQGIVLEKLADLAQNDSLNPCFSDGFSSAGASETLVSIATGTAVIMVFGSGFTGAADADHHIAAGATE